MGRIGGMHNGESILRHGASISQHMAGSDVQRQSTRPAEALELRPTPFCLQAVRPTRQHVA